MDVAPVSADGRRDQLAGSAAELADHANDYEDFAAAIVHLDDYAAEIALAQADEWSEAATRAEQAAA